MRRTARLDPHWQRFVLNIDYRDPAMFDVKRIEGRRFHPEIKAWSTPPSLRAWKQLERLGFEMLDYGGGRAYVEWLLAGAPVGEPYSLPRYLFPFQRTGVAWLKMRSHALLGDEPGLGKTEQAVEWARGDETVIVTAPNVVLTQWAEKVTERLGRPAVVKAPAEAGVWTIANYEYLPKLSAPDVPFTLVADEAHLLGNPKTRRTKLTMKLAERAKRVLLLTGTPPSRVVKWWPLLVMLRERDPKEFFPWALRYTGAERNDFGWDFSGATHLDELADDLRHVMLRRTKAEVLPDLPPKRFTTILASDQTKAEVKQLGVMDRELMDLVSKGHSLSSGLGLGALQRLRVHTSKTKIQTTIQWVLAQGVPSTKVIVFGEFLDSLHAIGEGIVEGSDEPCSVVYLTGETTDRAPLIRQFWDDPQCAVALCQYDAAAEGANLQCAGTVVLHDLPWTPDKLEQATDRAHRIGQVHDSVHVVTMLSGSQAERQMLDGLSRHQSITDALYGGPTTEHR